MILICPTTPAGRPISVHLTARALHRQWLNLPMTPEQEYAATIYGENWYQGKYWIWAHFVDAARKPMADRYWAERAKEPIPF